MAKKFTQREVEQLIAGIREAYEIKIRQLNYRLEGLTGENRSLRASLAEYKDREGKVGKAIVAAEEKGEEIKEFYRMSAQTEWQTLRLFADKWKALAAQTEGILPQGESESTPAMPKIYRRFWGRKLPLRRRKSSRRSRPKPRPKRRKKKGLPSPSTRRRSSKNTSKGKKIPASTSATSSTPRASSIWKSCAAI